MTKPQEKSLRPKATPDESKELPPEFELGPSQGLGIGPTSLSLRPHDVRLTFQSIVDNPNTLINNMSTPSLSFSTSSSREEETPVLNRPRRLS